MIRVRRLRHGAAPSLRQTVAAAAGTLLMAAASHAAVLRYPGAPPCNTTLQVCMDGANVGDTVEIGTTTLIDEELDIDKSLTLTAAAGFQPLIGGNTDTRTLTVEDGEDPTPIVVTISRLTLMNARIFVSLSDGGGHSVELRDCNVSHTMPSSDAPGGILVSLLVPATVMIRNNTVATTGRPISVVTRLLSGDALITVLGNQVTTSNPNHSSSGIAVDHGGAGTATTNVYSNVVHDVAGCNCGAASGIDIVSSGSVSATVNVINNTLDNAKAIQVGLPVVTSTLLVNVFNNIVNHATPDPLKFPARSAQLTINNGFNDLVKKDGAVGDFGGYTQGPSTFNLDPLFVRASMFNYRLSTGSPVVDVGTISPIGGLPTEDADKNRRVARLSVDLGAYELDSSRPSTPTSTTSTTSTTVPTNSPTTSTTLPAGHCSASVPTFTSIDCWLEVLVASTTGGIAPGTLRDRLLAQLSKATLQVQQAADFLGQGKPRSFKGGLGRATRALSSFEGRLRSSAGRLIAPAFRTSLRGASAELRRDLVTLRRA